MNVQQCRNNQMQSFLRGRFPTSWSQNVYSDPKNALGWFYWRFVSSALLFWSKVFSDLAGSCKERPSNSRGDWRDSGSRRVLSAVPVRREVASESSGLGDAPDARHVTQRVSAQRLHTSTWQHPAWEVEKRCCCWQKRRAGDKTEQSLCKHAFMKYSFKCNRR